MTVFWQRYSKIKDNIPILILIDLNMLNRGINIFLICNVFSHCNT